MNYTEEQFSVAFDKLPRTTQDVLFSAQIERMVKSMGSSLEILSGGLDTLILLANMAILKLADEKEFTEKLVAQLKINTDIAQKITSEVFSQIINPIRQKEEEEEKAQAEALEKAKVEEETAELEEEAAEVESVDNGTVQEEVPPVPLVPNVPRAPQLSGAAPDNLPVAEPPEYLTPPLAPKSANLEAWPPSEHPFEEKMKRVFTAGQQSMGELTLEPAHQNFSEKNLSGQAAPQTPDTARLSHDPYREAIE